MSSERIRRPAEWETHEAVWVAWPWDELLWQDALPAAQAEFVGLVSAIAGVDATRSRSLPAAEKVRVLVPDERHERAARAALTNIDAAFFKVPFGDIWLRDTAPIFTLDARGEVIANCFQFNGWGGKYVLEGDAGVAGAVAAESGANLRVFDWVLEGGAIECDGAGTMLTTRTCLLNTNRHTAQLTSPDIFGGGSLEKIMDARLAQAFGVSKVLWFDAQLENDHTDGHIDTLVRFAAPGVVVCMEPAGPSDPNRATLEKLIADVREATDARGERLRVHTIPSPGEVRSDDGELMPASYCNFYIGNRTVVVPTYGVPGDAAAVAAVAKLFPGRETVGRSARAILGGGGAFHCITQEQPAAKSP